MGLSVSSSPSFRSASRFMKFERGQARLVRSVFVAAVTCVLLAAGVYAANPPRLEISSVQETGNHITMVVSAYGSDGRALADLDPSSVTANLNGQPLRIASVQQASVDSSVGVVLLEI